LVDNEEIRELLIARISGRFDGLLGAAVAA